MERNFHNKQSFSCFLGEFCLEIENLKGSEAVNFLQVVSFCFSPGDGRDSCFSTGASLTLLLLSLSKESPVVV